MPTATTRSNPRRRTTSKMGLDEALMAVFIGAMAANGHVSPAEGERAHHLIWSTHRFRRRSGESVGRLIERVKAVLEDGDMPAIMVAAAGAIPTSLRRPAYAVVADLLLADGTIDARERRFLRYLAEDLRIAPGVAGGIVDAMLVKNAL